MSTTSAAALARLRTRFPGWDIIRTRCGTFIARHHTAGEPVTGHTLAELESRLRERAAGAGPRRAGGRQPG